MRKTENNYAFIDGQNLNLGIRELGWRLDFRKFRIYLAEKHAVRRAYFFIGYIPRNRTLYAALAAYGYALVFKEVMPNGNGGTKGNVDAELVLQAMIDYEHYHQAVIASGDGDFACLARYLGDNGKLGRILAPTHKGCSVLLKRAARGSVFFLEEAKSLLEY